jgi:hypothetical protein
MIAVILELQPARPNHHPELAEALGAELQRIPGHISVERFSKAFRRRGNTRRCPFSPMRMQAGTMGAYRLRLAYVGHDYGRS